MQAHVYFHRKSGTAIVSDDIERVIERLREQLGDRFVEADWLHIPDHAGPIRIRALGPGHLDVTTTFDPSILI